MPPWLSLSSSSITLLDIGAFSREFFVGIKWTEAQELILRKHLDVLKLFAVWSKKTKTKTNHCPIHKLTALYSQTHLSFSINFPSPYPGNLRLLLSSTSFLTSSSLTPCPLERPLFLETILSHWVRQNTVQLCALMCEGWNKDWDICVSLGHSEQI